MTSNLTRVGLCALALLAAGPDSSRGEEPAALVVLTLEDQANEIWSLLPEDPGDPRVTLLGGASRECAATALQKARGALAQQGGGRLALRSLSLPLSVPKPVVAGLSRSGASAQVIASYVTAETRSDSAAQPLHDSGCQDAGAFYDLRGHPDAPGRLFLHLLVEGACGCAQGASGGQRFHVAGEAELEPGILERKNVLRLRAKAPRYTVLAACSACAGAPSSAQPPAAAAKMDPCAAPCAPLTKGLAAWQREANEAAARLTELAGKATTLELNISTDRRELDTAQAARRKPRALLERISALQDRIKAAQAELARITRLSQEIQKYAAAAGQVADNARGADQRCQSQCRARQQQRPDRAPEKQASSGGGGAGTATAAAGGVSTGVLVAGGAALAAGGIAVATLGGGDEAPPAQPPPTFVGNWVGTRTTTATVNAPGCTRVYDERWVITQNGSELRADITATAQGCGNQPACGAGCTIFAFPRFHPGFAEGDTARFYVFPGLQVPSCVLPLRLSGNSLSGTMPACDTGAPDTLSDVVTLRRASP